MRQRDRTALVGLRLAEHQALARHLGDRLGHQHSAPIEVEPSDAQRPGAAWDAQHGWRVERVAEIEAALARHWAEVTLRAVRADDPLAFGIERLRDARATFGRDLQRILDGLPPDRREALALAEADLHHHEQNRRHAERSIARAAAELDRA